MKKLLCCLCLCLPVLSSAQEETRVVVMSSYPQELISRYEDAFEAAHPEIDMVLEWRRSDDARQLLESGNAAGVDVYWAPTLDTFVTLADGGHFAPLTLSHPALPGRIGELVIDDPQGRFAAFEVVGFGFAYSQDWLDARGLPVPHDWPDLADTRYAGALLLPVPSRHGFSPMIYASILQGFGWDEGWTLISALAANGALMTSGGGGFVDELVAAQRGIALSIDFIPRSAQLNGLPVGFRYADTTLLSPAYVALTKKAAQSAGAEAFLEFVLSDAGQTLLLHRDVARLPVRPSAYPADAEFDPFAAGVRVPAFDFQQAGAFQTLLGAVFDVQISTRHDVLVSASEKLHEAEQRAGSAGQARLAEARMLLNTPVLDGEAASALLAQLAQQDDPADMELPVQEWESLLAARTEQALTLIDDVLTAATAEP